MKTNVDLTDPRTNEAVYTVLWTSEDVISVQWATKIILLNEPDLLGDLEGGFFTEISDPQELIEVVLRFIVPELLEYYDPSDTDFYVQLLAHLNQISGKLEEWKEEFRRLSTWAKDVDEDLLGWIKF